MLNLKEYWVQSFWTQVEQYIQVINSMQQPVSTLLSGYRIKEILFLPHKLNFLEVRNPDVGVLRIPGSVYLK